MPSIMNYSSEWLQLPVRVFLFLVAMGSTCLQASEQSQPKPRCVVVEVYVSDGVSSEQARAAAERVAKSRSGILVAVRSVDDSTKNQERLAKIAQHYRFDEHATPVIYACNRVIRSGKDTNDFQKQLESALDIVVYTRSGCQRCEKAKTYLSSIAKRYPGLRTVYREILRDPVAARSLTELVRKHGKAASSTPVFHFCEQVIIGFDRPESTGARLQQTLNHWTVACPKSADKSKASAPANASQGVTANVPF